MRSILGLVSSLVLGLPVGLVLGLLLGLSLGLLLGKIWWIYSTGLSSEFTVGCSNGVIMG